MPGPEHFPTALQASLAKLLPDEQTQAAATALLDKYRNRVREIALVPNNLKVRVNLLGVADDELLDALDALNDTEQDDTALAEQPGQKQPAPAPIAAEQPGQEQPDEQPAHVEQPAAAAPAPVPASGRGRNKPKPQ